MAHQDEPKAAKSALKSFDSLLNFVTGPFFGPIAFMAGGAGVGVYIGSDVGISMMNGVIYGGVVGLIAWFAIMIYSWFS